MLLHTPLDRHFNIIKCLNCQNKGVNICLEHSFYELAGGLVTQIIL